ncbi:MAG: hypothetical protein AAB652_02380 [Patescibacteria group bacterium]
MGKIIASGFLATFLVFAFLSFQAIIFSPRLEVIRASANESIENSSIDQDVKNIVSPALSEREGAILPQFGAQNTGIRTATVLNPIQSPERNEDFLASGVTVRESKSLEDQTLAPLIGTPGGVTMSMVQNSDSLGTSEQNQNNNIENNSNTALSSISNTDQNEGEGNGATTTTEVNNNEEGSGIWEFIMSLKRDLSYYIGVINKLRGQLSELSAKVMNLQLTPGPQGPAGVTGAGNIAFIYKDGVGIHALRTDGTVWKWPASGWIAEGTPGISVPTSTSNIAQWQLTTFLDKNGDLWRHDAGVWVNFGHP